ncbi:TlpA disulfide reductase family protein [Isosphaeraceae bacterium EP7]
MRLARSAVLLAASALAMAGTARADEPGVASKSPFAGLEALNAEHSRRLAELERGRIVALTALAAKAQGEESELAYRELFEVAVAGNFYAEALPAAEARLTKTGGDPAVRALAVLVKIIARIDRGDHKTAVADLTAAFKASPDDEGDSSDAATLISLGEAAIQRLVRAGRFDQARLVCEITGESPSKPVRAHFAARRARLAMFGKSAPEIIGKDVDGKDIHLSDFKGKVILVDFWATWCPPCLEAMPALASTSAAYQGDGFVVLGVNVDSKKSDVGTRAKALPAVRRLLIAAGIDWPNIVLDGEPSEQCPTKLYGVDEIPASFLVDRDGTIIDIEVGPDRVRSAVEKALKSSPK